MTISHSITHTALELAKDPGAMVASIFKQLALELGTDEYSTRVVVDGCVTVFTLADISVPWLT
jgi:hypothetical protein